MSETLSSYVVDSALQGVRIRSFSDSRGVLHALPASPLLQMAGKDLKGHSWEPLQNDQLNNWSLRSC